MELVELSTAQLVVLGAVVAGATEFIKRLRAKDLWVAGTIVTSAVIGGLVALYYEADLLVGVQLGLAASGVFSLAGSVGNKSTPAESSVVK